MSSENDIQQSTGHLIGRYSLIQDKLTLLEQHHELNWKANLPYHIYSILYRLCVLQEIRDQMQPHIENT